MARLRLPHGHSVVESQPSLTAVAAAISTLPEDQQVLLALICIDDLSYKEAAQITGAGIRTVRSRLARARRNLHGQLSSSLP